jgi:hypothetical protein
MKRTVKASLLFFVLTLCALAIVATYRAQQHVPPPAPHQLFAVVEQHLSAFRAADYASVYRQASSGVQQKFTPPEYEAMIRQEYAEVARNQRIEFGLVKVSGPSAAVQVFCRDANGSTRAFLYLLIAEGGTWKINDVQPMRPTPRGLHI